MAFTSISRKINPADLSRQLRFHTSAQLAYRHSRARFRAVSVRRLARLGIVLGASASLGVALLASPWAGAALALAAGVGGGLGFRRAQHYQRYANLLEPLTDAERDEIEDLAQSSDVVKVALGNARRSHRDLCLVDLAYARALVVRETRSGGKPSDRLPLEQTRGLLAHVS